MKKKINIIFMIMLSLFVGLKISKAITVPITVGKFDCKTVPDKVEGDKKVTTCLVKGTATETATLSGSETWEVKYNDPTLHNDFKVLDTGGLGLPDKKQATENGGTFVFNYSGNITKGQEVTILTIEFYADNDPSKDCGGTVTPTGKADGGNSRDDSDQTIGDEETGISIPVAVIGLGAVIGLAVYSIASSKTKMHRI